VSQGPFKFGFIIIASIKKFNFFSKYIYRHMFATANGLSLVVELMTVVIVGINAAETQKEVLNIIFRPILKQKRKC
jgi:hypothetical protein